MKKKVLLLSSLLLSASGVHASTRLEAVKAFALEKGPKTIELANTHKLKIGGIAALCAITYGVWWLYDDWRQAQIINKILNEGYQKKHFSQYAKEYIADGYKGAREYVDRFLKKEAKEEPKGWGLKSRAITAIVTLVTICTLVYVGKNASDYAKTYPSAPEVGDESIIESDNDE